MPRNSQVTLGPGRICSCSNSGICRFGSRFCLVVIAALFCAAPASFADAAGPSVMPFHVVRGFAVIVPVTVNGCGPYDFMLDTGTTITTVDRELGQELALQPQGPGTAMTLSERIPASLALARSVVFGPMTEQNVEVMIRDLSGLRRMAPTTRGVLGQNSLKHTDFLLDYRHKFLAFDVDGELVRSLKGHHVPLRRVEAEGNPQYANLAVHASVTDYGVRAMDVLLDSGAASMVLFGGIERRGSEFAQGFAVDTAGRQMLADVREIQLVIDGNTREMATNVLAFQVGKEIGGLLPTSIFNSIYISNNGGFAMFEPKLKKSGSLDRMIAALTPQATPHGRKS
jgi:predicted aspartyl protease